MILFKKRKEEINKKDKKAKTKIKTNNVKEKQKYFDFYDDVKDYTKGKEDW